MVCINNQHSNKAESICMCGKCQAKRTEFRIKELENQEEFYEIYSGDSSYFYLSDVHHLEIIPTGGFVILKDTVWNSKEDRWENAVFINTHELYTFKMVWHRFRLKKQKNKGEQNEHF